MSGGGWQPIETAPQNVAVLVYIPHAAYYGNNCAYAAMLVSMGTGARWMTFGWAIGRDCSPEMQPTHWRPLPDPPTQPAPLHGCAEPVEGV